MRVYQKHAGDDAKLLIKFHWPNTQNMLEATHYQIWKTPLINPSYSPLYIYSILLLVS